MAVDNINSARDIVSKGSEQGYAVFLTYMAIIIYLFLAITSTTHEDLLKETSKSIPLMNLQISLVWLFSVGPWALAVIHLHQLIQYLHVSDNVSHLKKMLSIGGSDNCSGEHIFPSFYLLPNMLMSESRFKNCAIRFTLWFSLVLLPIAVNILFLAYFLPYHSEAISWDQRIAILLQIVFVAIIWPNILGRVRYFEGRRFVSVRSFIYIFRWCGLQTSVVLVLALSLCFCLNFPGEQIDFYKNEDSYLFARVFPRNLDLQGKVLIKSDPNYLFVSSRQSLNKNNYETFAEAVQFQHLGLNLSGRDLRYANFKGVVMPSCIFSGSALDRANFSQSYLENSVFGNSVNNYLDIETRGKISKRMLDLGVEQTNNRRTSVGSKCDMLTLLYENFEKLGFLSDVKQGIKPTQMNYCEFDYSKLLNVNFDNASCKECSFVGATIYNSYIRLVDFSKSHFFLATVANSDFSWSKFINAKFDSISVSNSTFIFSDFSSASIVRSKLLLSDFSGSTFKSSYFNDTNFLFSSFVWSIFDGVRFIDNEFTSPIVLYSKFNQCYFTDLLIVHKYNMVPRSEDLVKYISDSDYKYALGVQMYYLLEKLPDCRDNHVEINNAIVTTLMPLTSEKNMEYFYLQIESFYSR